MSAPATAHPQATREIAAPRILALTTVVCVAGIASAAIGLVAIREPYWAAASGAFVIGWSHLAGRCGKSHLGTLAPFGKVRGRRGRWLVSMLLYTVSGLLASSLVGAGLATFGDLVLPDQLRTEALIGVLVLAGVAAAGDLRLVPWRLPQPRRQTRQSWGYLFSRPVAAVLWGFGLGLTVATVFTFSAIWLVLALPVAVGEPAVGAILLAVHWLGRVLSVLVGPLLLRSAGDTLDLLDRLDRSTPIFRTASLIGLALMSISLLPLLTGIQTTFGG